jgi:hypothetical protein
MNVILMNVILMNVILMNVILMNVILMNVILLNESCSRNGILCYKNSIKQFIDVILQLFVIS